MSDIWTNSNLSMGKIKVKQFASIEKKLREKKTKNKNSEINGRMGWDGAVYIFISHFKKTLISKLGKVWPVKPTWKCENEGRSISYRVLKDLTPTYAPYSCSCLSYTPHNSTNIAESMPIDYFIVYSFIGINTPLFLTTAIKQHRIIKYWFFKSSPLGYWESLIRGHWHPSAR